MMPEADDKPLPARVWPDVFAFLFWLFLAYTLQWETKDLVWSLWLSSLVTGYLTILGTLASGAVIGTALVNHPEFKPEHRQSAILFGGGLGLFLLGFFSLHFCGFHAGHSVFLNSFFPLEGAPKDGFGDAFVNPPLLWVLVFKHVMPLYGLFLIPALIAEREHVFEPLWKARQLVNMNQDPEVWKRSMKATAGSGGMGKDLMGRPYLNVIRMHCLIFFFGFCHFLKIDSFLVYAVVYSVYFFPWHEIKGMLAKSRPSEENREVSGELPPQ